MYNKVTDINESKSLPLNGNLINIDYQGIIRDFKGNIINPYLDDKNNLLVTLPWIDGLRAYSVAFLVAITFKPLRIPMQYWCDIKVLFKDNNPLNVNPSNLVWKFPTTGIKSNKFKGFYYIPGFTRYIINREGSVINTFSGENLSGSKRPAGYVYFCLKSDNGKSNPVGRHRLLALTFLDYPVNMDELDVNHIDGIPGNDDIDNLEWASRSFNALHAYSTGLRTDNKPVIVTNHNTGEEIEYFSAYECERQLGLSKSVVHYRIKKGQGKIYKPGYSFRYKDGRQYTECHSSRYGIPVHIKNISTGEVITFPSIIKCAEYLNVVKKVIQKRAYQGKFIYKGYEISIDPQNTVASR